MSKPDERLMEEIGRVFQELYAEAGKEYDQHCGEHSVRPEGPAPKWSDYVRNVFEQLIERGILIPRDQVDAAVAAAYVQACMAVCSMCREGLPLEPVVGGHPIHNLSIDEYDVCRAYPIHALIAQPQQDALDAERQRVRLEEAESIAKAECGLCQEGIPVYQCEEPSCWMHVNSGSYKESHPICDAQFAQERIAAMHGGKG